MLRNLHPKCANPSCAEAFDWLGGGKLFRFRRDPGELSEAGEGASHFTNSHHVEHFWLCERCSNIFTLNYEADRGVAIRLLWPELPAGEKRVELPVL
jgi:hypothetical protein